MASGFRRIAFSTFAALAFWQGLAATSLPADSPDPFESRDRVVVTEPIGFHPFVFAGKSFPECRFADPEKVAKSFGPFTIKATYYNRDGEAVQTPTAPGRYAAIVEVVPKKGRTLRRFFSLYKTPKEIPPDWRFNPRDAETMASVLGVDAGVVVREAGNLAESFKGRPFGELAGLPQTAALLAGLRESKVGKAAVGKDNDAFAVDRQWWVSFKRKRDGMDAKFPDPFVGPRPIAGDPARVVREGTPAEAGMKPNTAEAIDAACRAWAADSDQAFAVCVVRRGVIVLHKAYGTRDGKPMTVDTKSWMASITKTMSASLMMMLVDRGLVGLDDRVDAFLPSLRSRSVETPLTIRHLYTHTNGLDRWPGWNDAMPDVPELVAFYQPHLKVGKTWAYNGVGYILGGKVIEAVSGETVPAFYARHLLAPLGCEHTDVVGTHGDARSVPLDIARFGQMLLNRGSYGRFEFFKPETFEAMLPQRLTKVLGPDAAKTFGIGLDGNAHQYGHGAASAATFHIDRDEELVVVMTRNAIGTNYDKYNGPFWQAIKDGFDRPTGQPGNAPRPPR